MTPQHVNSNTFENDYILQILQHFVTDLKTDKPREQIFDKYAVELTAFMNGRIVEATRNTELQHRINAHLADSFRKLLDYAWSTRKEGREP